MQFYIDITNSAGARFGAGPITSATFWRSTERVDRAGSFQFAFPASDEKASIVQRRRYAVCYAILDTGPTEIGRGIIDLIDFAPDPVGNVMMVVSGDDLLRELAWRSVEFLALYSGTNPVTHATAVTSLLGKMPAGWTRTAASSPGNDDIYYEFAGESCLAAAIKVAELSRCHVWMNTARNLKFDTVWPDSGLRAIEAPVEPDISDANTCFIEQLTWNEDTFDLISRALPYGGEIVGGSGALTTLADCTKAAPSGYTLNTTDKYIKADQAETDYGRVEGWMKFPDIRANSTAAADKESASNQLFDLALRVLQLRSEPAQFFVLTLAHAPEIIRPFRTIRCLFRRVADDRVVVTIDEDLYIMGATTEINEQELRTTALDVATVDRWADNDVTPIAEMTRNNLRIG